MAMTCKKCGATTTGDQAFCAKCGAVIGMEGAPEGDQPTPPNLAATIVGQHFNIPPPPPKPTPPTTKQPSATVVGEHGAAASRPTARVAFAAGAEGVKPGKSGGSKTALLVVLGFVAVLLVGAILLLALFFLMGGGHV